jgi:MFS family permease
VATPFSVLTRNRDFRRLFAAELVVFGADWFVMVPLLVLLPELTGSGVWGALVLAADTGIHALLLPYTGTVADRVDRRLILIAANVAALLGILLLFTVRSAATAPLALVAIGVVAVAKAFYSPAASAALPNVVDPDDLAAANSVAGSAWGTMTIVGASLGGIVSSAFGAYVSFVVAAASLFAAVVLTLLIRRPLQAPREAAPPPHAWHALIEALRYIGSRPRIRALVTVKSAVGLGNGVLTVFPLLAALYGVGSLGAGLLFAVRGAGALIGPLLMRPVLNHRSWLLPGLALSMSLYGLSYIGVAFVSWFPVVLVLVFLAHFAGGTNWVMSNYALQGEVPDRLRGRVFATDMMLATLAISVSQLGAAAFVDRVDERVILIACGLITVVYAVGWRIATRRLSLADPERPESGHAGADPADAGWAGADPADAGPVGGGQADAGRAGTDRADAGQRSGPKRREVPERPHQLGMPSGSGTPDGEETSVGSPTLNGSEALETLGGLSGRRLEPRTGPEGGPTTAGSAAARPAGAGPAEAGPAGARPGEARSSRPGPSEARPTVARPAEARPAARPTVARPAEARPAAWPAEARPSEARPSEARPSEARPSEARATETRAGEAGPAGAGRPGHHGGDEHPDSDREQQ